VEGNWPCDCKLDEGNRRRGTDTPGVVECGWWEELSPPRPTFPAAAAVMVGLVVGILGEAWIRRLRWQRSDFLQPKVPNVREKSTC